MKRRRKSGEERAAQEVTQLMFGYALKGEVWAARAIADAIEGTVDGTPPPIDQDALLESGLTAKQIVREIRRAYLAATG